MEEDENGKVKKGTASEYSRNDSSFTPQVTAFTHATSPNPLTIPGRTIGPTRRSTKGGWTEEEDNILAGAVEKFKCKNWKKIAESFPDRTAVQCLHRWQKVLNPNVVKGPWRKEEDELICFLVETLGTKKWSEIAKHLPGRIGKQCRERWYNHLNPDIKRTPWTEEEDLTLLKAHEIYGNKWAEIAKFLHGRTENSIKNRWNSSGKKLESRSARGIEIPSYGMKTGSSSRNSEVEQQIFDQQKTVERISDSSSPDLVHRIGHGTKGRLPWPTTDKDNCYFLRTDRNDSVNPTVGVLNPTTPKAACCLTSTECRKNASAADICEYQNLNRFQNSCEISHESPSSISSFQPEPLPNSPSFLPLSTPKSDELHLQKMKDAGTPENLEELNHGWLNYEPLQLKDLNYFLETGSFPSTDSYIRAAGSPISSSTPTIQNRMPSSPSCRTSESILKCAARSFKSTPSIIRKNKFCGR